MQALKSSRTKGNSFQLSFEHHQHLGCTICTDKIQLWSNNRYIYLCIDIYIYIYQTSSAHGFNMFQSLLLCFFDACDSCSLLMSSGQPFLSGLYFSPAGQMSGYIYIYIYTYFCCVIYQGPQLKHTNAYKIIQELLKPAIPDSPSMASMLSFHGIMIGIGCFFWRGGVQGALALAARPQVGRTSVWAAEDSWAAGLRWFCGANAVFRRYTRYIQVIPSVHAG